MKQAHDQFEQVQSVMDYIDEHIDEDLTLEKLAAQSNYSPFHFHRVFTQIAGETPASYVKRVRMERAAHLLIYEPDIPVTDIALQCGFTSLSYFTQAFKQMYHVSPKAWREGEYLKKFPLAYEDSKISKQMSRKPQEYPISNPYNQFQWVDLSRVKIIEIPSFSYVWKQHIGNYTEEVYESWEEVFRWVKAREYDGPDGYYFGYPRNNPFITPEGKCRYDCCIRVKESVEGATTFNGGKFAVYEFENPLSYDQRNHIIHCYTEMYSIWLPKSGFRFVGNPVEFVEILPIPNSLHIQAHITGIAIPIEPK